MFAYDAIRRVLTEDRELLEEKSKVSTHMFMTFMTIILS